MKKYAVITIEAEPIKNDSESNDNQDSRSKYLFKTILFSYKSKTTGSIRTIYNKCKVLAIDEGLSSFVFGEDSFYTEDSITKEKKLFKYARISNKALNIWNGEDLKFPWKEFRAERDDDAKLLFEISKGEKNE